VKSKKGTERATEDLERVESKEVHGKTSSCTSSMAIHSHDSVPIEYLLCQVPGPPCTRRMCLMDDIAFPTEEMVVGLLGLPLCILGRCITAS